MSFLNGYKTYFLSLTGALISAGSGFNGTISPTWATIITLGWGAIAAFRHGQKTDAEKQALSIAKFMSEEVKNILIEKGLVKQSDASVVQKDAELSLIDGKKLIEAINALMKPAAAVK